MKLSLQNHIGTDDSIVADFASEEAAANFAIQLGRQEKSPNWMYSYIGRPTESKTKPKPVASNASPRPVFTFVSPKWLNSGDPDGKPEKENPQLEGLKASGTFGKDLVNVEFQADGRAKISGELSGDGTWKLTDERLKVETSKSIFRGVVGPHRIVGYRFLKDNSEPIQRCDLTLPRD